jgi:hypothetical protein
LVDIEEGSLIISIKELHWRCWQVGGGVALQICIFGSMFPKGVTCIPRMPWSRLCSTPFWVFSSPHITPTSIWRSVYWLVGLSRQERGVGGTYTYTYLSPEYNVDF